MEVLKALRDRPRDFVEVVSVHACDAFLRGYGAVDASMATALQSPTAFPGPSAANRFTRAYLCVDDLTAANEQVLDELLNWGSAHGANLRPTPEPYAGERALRRILEAIRQGRWGMMMPEPSVTYCAHYVRGFILASETIAPTIAEDDRRAMIRFEEWLQRRYRQPNARWHRVLRVFGGDPVGSVKLLLEEWDAFSAADGVPGATSPGAEGS
jgi:hypothetical protein